MKALKRFAAGGLLATVVLAGATLAARTAAADIKLACSGNICCTYDSESGKIYDCKAVAT